MKPVKAKAVKVMDSAKRDLFIRKMREIIWSGEGTPADAYIESGYKPGNRNLASLGASKLKKHPQVQNALKEFQEILREVMPPEAVGLRLSEIAFKGEHKDSLKAISIYKNVRGLEPVKKQAIGIFRADLAELE